MENLNFVALDLETATSSRSSICEIGITIVRNSEIIETKSWLVRPEHNEYDPFNTYLHGITPKMTKDSASFPDVWKEVLPYLNHNVVVAHNTSFDMYALRDSFDKYGIEYPEFKHFCSCRLAKYVFKDTYSYSLSILCEAMGVVFDAHHRAGDDSNACAKVFIKSLNLAEVQSLDELQEKYHFNCGEFKHAYFRPQLANKNAYFLQNKIGDIIADSSKFDEGNYFYGKTVCFTGKLMYAKRTDLWQAIANIGGQPVDSVTKKTNVLVVGQQEYRVVGDSGMSTKQKKAMELKDKGFDIEILSESEFLNFL